MQLKKVFFSLVAIFGLALLGIGGLSYGQELSEQTSLVMVSHSEYKSNETGQIIGKLYDYRGSPILATCNVTIYNPDKTIFLNPKTTDDTLETLDGTHYINFTTPSSEGVYEYMINCGFTLNSQFRTRKISNSFHLSPALNTITNINSTINSINSSIGSINAINFTNISVTLGNIFDNLFSDIDAYNNFTQIQSNFSTINTKLNYVSNNLSAIMQYCSNQATNSSELCRLVWDNNQRIIAINDTLNNVVVAKLNVINQTTQNTYDFLIVNVTQNFNSIFSSLSTIQAGINQINTTSNKILQNTTAIIENQQDVIYIDVVS